MFKALIYKENKVFSTQLKRSEPIEPLLSKIRQKEDLSTAILLLEGEGRTSALFILENKLYALYSLDALHFSPLLFSDFFKEAAQGEAQVRVYQASPVLFKCLLIVAQSTPSVVGTPAVINLERILEHINKNNQEAVLVFKEDTQVQVFYFLNGNVRDMYFGRQKETHASSDLKNQVFAAASKGNAVQVLLFKSIQISAAKDCEMAEQVIAEAQAAPAPIHATSDMKKIPPGANKTDAPPLWVKVLGGSRAGFLIRFSPKPVSLGRGNVAVRLNDPQVSRFHAELAWGKDGLFIRDNHSTNGIFVNDEKVYRKTLARDDIIRLGDVRLKVIAGS